MPQTQSFSIGALAHQTGVKPSALRYYESIGILSAPQRVGGQRRYEAKAFDIVRFIQAAQRVGFTLDEIKAVLDESPDEQSCCTAHLQQLARDKIREVDALIERATAMKKALEAGLSCQCSTLADCLLFQSDERPGK